MVENSISILLSEEIVTNIHMGYINHTHYPNPSFAAICDVLDATFTILPSDQQWLEAAVPSRVYDVVFWYYHLPRPVETQYQLMAIYSYIFHLVPLQERPAIRYIGGDQGVDFIDWAWVPFDPMDIAYRLASTKPYNPLRGRFQPTTPFLRTVLAVPPFNPHAWLNEIEE